MPAPKSQSLNRSHQTREEKQERESAEAAMTPKTQLETRPPALLQKHKPAQEIWKRLIGLYQEVDGTIVTAFDADLLAKYCLLEEECTWLEKKRSEVEKNCDRLNKQLAKMNPKAEQLKDYYSLLTQYVALTARVQGLDARLDGKRKLVHALAQSLYLTPRSRAGVAPASKTKEQEDGFSEFD